MGGCGVRRAGVLESHTIMYLAADAVYERHHPCPRRGTGDFTGRMRYQHPVPTPPFVPPDAPVFCKAFKRDISGNVPVASPARALAASAAEVWTAATSQRVGLEAVSTSSGTAAHGVIGRTSRYFAIDQEGRIEVSAA